MIFVSVPAKIRLYKLWNDYRTIEQNSCLFLLEPRSFGPNQYESSVYLSLEFGISFSAGEVRTKIPIEVRNQMFDEYMDKKKNQRSIAGWEAFNLHSFEKVWISEYDLKYIEEFQKAVEMV